MDETISSPLAAILQELRMRKVATPRVEAAFHLAMEFYVGTMHWVGISTAEHVASVLRALLAFEPDEDALVACVLHHTLDSKRITLTNIEEQFGHAVRALVSGVHLLSQVQMQTSRHSVQHLRIMLLSVADDVRVLLIILCDRASLLEELPHASDEDRKWICQNVLHLFAPVASRLGIHALKQRMENAAFPVLYPNDSALIQTQLQHVHARYADFLPEVAAQLRNALADQGITAGVDGREKHPYSIFLKMRTKSVSDIERLHDLFALRIIVETEADCYRALGVVHQLGRPAANRFKDYIAFPKPNGYRSLHTTMARFPGVPEGIFTEVQIRTSAMHREAEFGIAAHWHYKERGSAARVVDSVQLQEVLSKQHDFEQEEEATSIISDHIYVLTPSGDIVELPEGATPLDFAFQIHTDLGLSFKSARVNGSIVPLTYELENGDVVEIVRNRTPQPSPEWLKLVKMASSRARLKRYLHSLNRSEYVARGRTLLNEEFQKLHHAPLDTDLSALRLHEGSVLSVHEREDLLMKIGQGSERASAVLSHLDTLRPLLQQREKQKRAKAHPSASGLVIDGGLRMPVRFAKCCKPNNTHEGGIVGIVTRNGRITVHREGCRMIRLANAERMVGVRWEAG